MGEDVDVSMPDANEMAKRIFLGSSISDYSLLSKKTEILRAIGREIAEGLVPETILENLEIVEKLDRVLWGNAVALGSMREAYCMVALECTVKLLVAGDGKPSVKYWNAFDRIWRGKVVELERCGESDLITRELRKWRVELESLFYDRSVCKKLCEMNTRNEAVNRVLVYLKEEEKIMGLVDEREGVGLEEKRPCNLGKESSLKDSEMQGVRNDHEVVDEADGGGMALPDAMEGIRSLNSGKESSFKDSKMKGVRNDHGVVDEAVNGGMALPDAMEGIRSLNSVKELSFKDPKMVGLKNDHEVVDEAVNGGMTLLDAMEEIRLLDLGKESSFKDLEMEGLRNDYEVVHEAVDGGMALPDAINEEIHEEDGVKVKISYVKDSNIDESTSICKSLATDEVNEVEEEVRASCLELQTAVTGPSLEAFLGAEIMISLSTDGTNGKDTPKKQSEKEEANQIVPKIIDPLFKTGDVNLGNLSCENQGNVPRLSLMERNSTACTYEWNEPIDDSPKATTNDERRTYRPNPKRKVVNSLVENNGAQKISGRRKNRRWSLHEEDTLRTAVKRYGNHWKVILNTYHDEFDERTEVDLKDKWRNMMKYSHC